MKMKRTASRIVLTLLLTNIVFIAFDIQPARASGTIYIRADGSVYPSAAPIQRNGDVYTLTGNITSDADGIVVERDNLVIDGSGFVVEGTGTTSSRGIYVNGKNNVTIINVNVRSFQDGIYLYYSKESSISGNNITANNSYGIWLSDSSDSILSGNDITNNEGGIQLYWSPNNMLRNNSVANNNYGFAIYGGSLSYYIQDIDISNTVNGKPIYYWINRQNLAVPSDTGYVALVNCTGMTLKNLNLTENGQGALLAYTTDSTITENSITDNCEGLYLSDSSNNTITGNNISGNSYAGIFLNDNNNYNTISKNNVTDGYFGIYVENHSGNNTVSENNVTTCHQNGIYVSLSQYNSIYANIATNSKNGIYVYEAHDNFFTRNLLGGNTECGICLWNSGNNTLTKNNLTGNLIGFVVNAEYLSDFYQNIDSSNLVNGKPIYYLMDLKGTIITQNDYPDIGYMVLVNSNSVVIENVSLQGVEGLELAYSENCSVKNMNIGNCTFAVWLLSSNNNTVSNVTVSNGYVGILYLNSTNNSAFENIIGGNEYGIWSLNSHGNAIYHNSFLDNSQQARSEQSADVWDDGYPSGGNYWSDYNPLDENKDKIGDTPYIIDENNTDRYPLIYPHECYAPGYVCSPDLNKDGIINIIDITKVARAFGCKPGDSNWSPTVDMDLNEIINIVDVTKVAKEYGKAIWLLASTIQRSIVNLKHAKEIRPPATIA